MRGDWWWFGGDDYFGGDEISGRPKEGNKFGKDSGARGRDPIGSHDRRKQYGIALAHYDAMKKDLKKLSRNDRKLLEETLDVEKEYSNEVDSLIDNKNDWLLEVFIFI